MNKNFLWTIYFLCWLSPRGLPAAPAIRCTLKTPKRQPLQFQALRKMQLGSSPRVRLLKDEKDPSRMRQNPTPQDTDGYLRAGSALRVLWNHKGNHSDSLQLLVAQDSRSRLGMVELPTSLSTLLNANSAVPQPRISMLPTESKKYESTYENPGRDYQSFRKKYKKDYEALTTLPDGRLLILGSGSDIGKKGKLSQRTGALICEPRTGEIQTFDLMGFFRQLRAHAEIVGNVKVHAKRNQYRRLGRQARGQPPRSQLFQSCQYDNKLLRHNDRVLP